MSLDAELRALPNTEILTADRTGSDFMVDVIKSLGIGYVCSNPGSSFRGLHESIINYGGNRAPEFITCRHEESSGQASSVVSSPAGELGSDSSRIEPLEVAVA